MDDLISRQAAIEVIDAVFPVNPTKSEYAQGLACGAALAKTYVEQLPSAQSERMKGKWIRNDNGTYSCSVCQSWIPEEQRYYARYCLYCGADMRGAEDD